MHPSYSRNALQPAKQVTVVITDDDVKRTWCRWCFRTHYKHEQDECKQEAHKVFQSEAFWTPEEIVGWRGFKIVSMGTDNEPMLRGMRAGWAEADPGPAECITQGNALEYDHKSPHPLCTCGYHALKERSAISSQMPVHAKVLMWGDVIEHEDGYRAERVKIIGLDYTNNGMFLFQRRERVHHTMHKLRQRYEVKSSE